jgi:hypothetical protein
MLYALTNIISEKFNAIRFKKVKFRKNSTQLRFNKVNFWKNPTLYALKTLIFNLMMPSSALDTFCEPAIYGRQPVGPVPYMHENT